MMKSTKQIIEQLESELKGQRDVIRAFYEEMLRLDLMPDGLYQWTEEAARRLAQGIAEKAAQRRK